MDIEEVDIINHPGLGDTLIDYKKDPPAKQWMQIAVMLREQKLIVIKDEDEEQIKKIWKIVKWILIGIGILIAGAVLAVTLLTSTCVRDAFHNVIS